MMSGSKINFRTMISPSAHENVEYIRSALEGSIDIVIRGVSV